MSAPKLIKLEDNLRMSDKQTTENAVDYKATLNLPDTQFAMKANLAVREVKWLEEWYTDNIYQQIRASRISKKKYILHDGPPYANGTQFTWAMRLIKYLRTSS